MAAVNNSPSKVWILMKKAPGGEMTEILVAIYFPSKTSLLYATDWQGIS
jgi:hypothetical protein